MNGRHGVRRGVRGWLLAATGYARGAAVLAALLFVTTFAACAHPPPPQRVPASVSFVETVDHEFNRYRVAGVTAASEPEARVEGVRDALVYASLHLTGSDAEKAALEGKRETIVAWTDLGQVHKVVQVVFHGDAPVITVVIDVNVKALRRRLEGAKLIKSDDEVSAGIEQPVVLVRREGSMLGEPSDTDRIIIDRIASFFTQRKFAMADEKATADAGMMAKAAEGLDGALPDPIAEVAALAGADVYVTFTAKVTGVVKATASVKAFETSTGRLIASATGESRGYPAGTPEMDAIREAVSDGIPKVSEDISGYWHEDLKKGRTYLFAINGDLADHDRMKAFRTQLKKSGELKVIVKTPKRYTGTLRSHGKPDAVEDTIVDALKGAGFSEVAVTLSTRSLFVLRVP